MSATVPSVVPTSANAGNVKTSATLWRVRQSFADMPGLCVNCREAERIWQIDATTAEAVLQELVEIGYLRKGVHGFVRT